MNVVLRLAGDLNESDLNLKNMPGSLALLILRALLLSV